MGRLRLEYVMEHSTLRTGLEIQSQRLLRCDWLQPLLKLAMFLAPVVRDRKYLL